MPNHIKNRIHIMGTQVQINAVYEQLSTHFPREKRKAFDGKLIFKHKTQKHTYGWLEEETNLFTKMGQDPVNGAPEDFEQDYTEEWIRFPDFDKIVPMPESLNVESGTIGETGYAVLTGKTESIFGNIQLYLNRFWEAPLERKKEMIERGFIYAENMEKYGHATWYSWSREKWGTKWNSYSCERINDGMFDFETAWNGVPNLIYKISKMFPEVKFYYEWSDEDTGSNCGCGQAQNGVGGIAPVEDCSKEAYEIAFRLRPDRKEDYKLVDGKYVYVDEDEDN
jgi:hypothetical protein